ncbi:hypothetical protein M422DRAFT_276372 [Sphaerobolus stellatus SS14]|uniref:Killer toxin Kp4 domain-containing protein n=1 Tax=Sphaerobolus stellatus (strain SS14) TaxID=990650 RepID=A0A0C9UDC2_SPHS4|nr:hypothetical protein M422DRAFT_276372 [Sphaerobolus stellatus SS14]
MNSYFKAILAFSLAGLVPSANAVGCLSGGQAGDCSGAISQIYNMVNGVVFSAGQTISTCVNENGFLRKYVNPY